MISVPNFGELAAKKIYDKIKVERDFWKYLPDFKEERARPLNR